MSATWITVCEKSSLNPNTGICALVGNEQVAIFWESITKGLFAVANFDPIGEANVMSRGIVGSLGGALVVASPLYKQHFDLRSGECLELPEHRLKTWDVREHEGLVQVLASMPTESVNNE